MAGQEELPALRVRELRKARGWTQMDLALRAGLWTSEISRIETGHRGLKVGTLLKLADALGVGVGELFPQREPPNPPSKRTKPEKVVQLMAEMPADSGDMSTIATAWAGPGKQGLERLGLLRDAAAHLTPEDGNRLTVQIAVMAAWWGRLFELKAANEISEEEATKAKQQAA